MQIDTDDMFSPKIGWFAVMNRILWCTATVFSSFTSFFHTFFEIIYDYLIYKSLRCTCAICIHI
jgi:hypothetical protein